MKTPTNQLTKPEAIKLWQFFIDSDRVEKDLRTKGGHGGTNTWLYDLILKHRGYPISKLTLHVFGFNYGELPEEETATRELITPYGSYELSKDEANHLLTKWKQRDNLPALKYEELIKLL